MILPMAFSHWGPDSDREPSYVLACFVEKSAMLWQDKTTANTLPDVLYKLVLSYNTFPPHTLPDVLYKLVLQYTPTTYHIS